MLVVKNDQATTEFDPNLKILKSVYIGRYQKELAIGHIKKVMKFYSHNEVKGSLIDISQGYGSFAKLFEFLTTSYYPIAAKSGLSVQVYIVSSDLLSSALGEKLGYLASQFNIKSNLFVDKKEAEQWLVKMLK